MSTTTITPEALAASVSSVQTSLLKSFWLKIKGIPTPSFAAAKGLMSKIVRAIPGPAASVAAPVALATRWGYNLLGRVLGWGFRMIGKTVSKVASLNHKAANWVASKIEEFVAIFSEPAANKVGDALAKFGEGRMWVGTVVRSFFQALSDRTHEAYYAPQSRRSIMFWSAAMVGFTLFSVLFGGPFTAMLGWLMAHNMTSVAVLLAQVTTSPMQAIYFLAGLVFWQTLFTGVFFLVRDMLNDDGTELATADPIVMKAAPVADEQVLSETETVLEGIVVETPKAKSTAHKVVEAVIEVSTDPEVKAAAEEQRLANDAARKVEFGPNKPSPTKRKRR
jgi:hypothetical protein